MWCVFSVRRLWRLMSIAAFCVLDMEKCKFSFLLASDKSQNDFCRLPGWDRWGLMTDACWVGGVISCSERGGWEGDEIGDRQGEMRRNEAWRESKGGGGGRPHWEINMKHVIQFNIKLLNKFWAKNVQSLFLSALNDLHMGGWRHWHFSYRSWLPPLLLWFPGSMWFFLYVPKATACLMATSGWLQRCR